MRALERRPLMRCRFGSHLYGTDTPASDADYKGVFLPASDEVIRQAVPKSIRTSTGSDRSRNTAADVDDEMYSLHYFLKLAGKGETVALDMLHAPPEQTLASSEEWRFIQRNRAGFYTKNLRSYVAYCRGQAAKYGVKGSRLDDCRRVMEFLDGKDGKLADHWDDLPAGEHIRKYEEPEASQRDKRVLDVCSRKMPATSSAAYAHSVFAKYYDAYGSRAHLAAQNEGIDWKAISHAFRGGFQVREILTTGDLKYPLRDRGFLKRVKAGELHYLNDGVGGMLDDLVQEVHELSEASGLPDSVDMAPWDEFLVALYTGADWRLPGLVVAA